MEYKFQGCMDTLKFAVDLAVRLNEKVIRVEQIEGSRQLFNLAGMINCKAWNGYPANTLLIKAFNWKATSPEEISVIIAIHPVGWNYLLDPKRGVFDMTKPRLFRRVDFGKHLKIIASTESAGGE